MKPILLPNQLWYDNQPREIQFPDRWKIDLLEPSGFKKAPISDEAIGAAFAAPIGSPRLEELAREAEQVAIVFDDITRPTPVSRVLPRVLRALEQGGVAAENIRFIPALGLHGAMNNIEFRKKLGDNIVRNYPIYNHNPYEHCDYVADTPGGIPLYLNREFLSCDLKIGIGCITPHVHVGFGGGGKLVFPGISGIESVYTFHSEVFRRRPQKTGLGRFDGNPMYAEIADAVRLAGLQCIINGTINDRGQLTHLFVGDPVEAHAAGVNTAKQHYVTTPSPDKDIVVVNAYAKANEMPICMFLAAQTVKSSKGIIVLVVDAPEGQICHYLFRSFGKHYGGRMYPRGGGKTFPVAPQNVQVIVCTAYPDQTMGDMFASPDEITITPDWEETLSLLEEQYPERAAVAVIPDGTMQYFAE